MKDKKLEFAQVNNRNLSGHLWHILSSRCLIVYENRVLVNQKTFHVEKRKSASLTITGIVSNANANRDTQGAHAVSCFFFVVITYHKTHSRVFKRYYYNMQRTMSANNTAGASDTRPVFVCCEIIMSNVISHELVNNCFIIRKKKFSTPVPKFLFCFGFCFYRSIEQLTLSIWQMWLLALNGTENRASSIGSMNHASCS